MSMAEFIQEEKAKLQALFEPFNERGSWMRLSEKGMTTLVLGLVDSFLVTRVAPQFDAGGQVKKVDFWLFFKMAGYHHGFQFSHTIKVVAWSQDDTYLIDLVDDFGREYHVELLFPTLDLEYVADWKDWKKYKAENRDMFERTDADLLEEHIRMAEEWE